MKGGRDVVFVHDEHHLATRIEELKKQIIKDNQANNETPLTTTHEAKNMFVSLAHGHVDLQYHDFLTQLIGVWNRNVGERLPACLTTVPPVAAKTSNFPTGKFAKVYQGRVKNRGKIIEQSLKVFNKVNAGEMADVQRYVHRLLETVSTIMRTSASIQEKYRKLHQHCEMQCKKLWSDLSTLLSAAVDTFERSLKDQSKTHAVDDDESQRNARVRETFCDTLKYVIEYFGTVIHRIQPPEWVKNGVDGSTQLLRSYCDMASAENCTLSSLHGIAVESQGIVNDFIDLLPFYDTGKESKKEAMRARAWASTMAKLVSTIKKLTSGTQGDRHVYFQNCVDLAQKTVHRMKKIIIRAKKRVMHLLQYMDSESDVVKKWSSKVRDQRMEMMRKHTAAAASVAAHASFVTMCQTLKKHIVVLFEELDHMNEEDTIMWYLTMAPRK